MGAFALIEKKEYEAFCALYTEKAHLSKTHPEYADLMPGNYITALIGAEQYDTLVAFCLETMEEIRRSSPKIDRSSSKFYIALSVGYFQLGRYPEALEALREGSRAAYQDRPRTQVAGILCWEATELGDKKAKRESSKLLNARLRNKDCSLPELAPAQFLAGKCGEEETLARIDTLPPVLRERAKVQALFYMAVKAMEAGDTNRYARRLEDACALYDSAPAVTMEFEYQLAEICRSRLGG